MSDGKLIATIEKNRSETVHVSLDTFNGHELVDVRVFASYGEGDEPKPTKKGVSLKVERLQELIDALTAAKRDALLAGLIVEASDG